MHKVAYFIDSRDPGGAEMLVFELSKRVATYGFKPEIFHFGNEWLQRQAKEIGVVCIEAPALRYYRSIKTLPLFALAFSKILHKRSIDVLHSHLYGAIVGASMATALKRIPHIGTMHDTYTIEARPSRFLSLQIASILGTRLVVVSEDMREYFHTVGKLFRPRSLKICNGVDIGKFNVPARSGLRKVLRLKPDDITFISVARLIDIKRFDVLLRGIAKLKGEHPVRLLVVGDGPCRAEIQQLVVACGLHEHVNLLGARDDIPQLLSVSDCFVLASDSEGLSYSIMESMASGVPAVVTDVGGNRELVKHDESGYLVPRRDPDALADYLRRVVNDEAKRRTLGKAARRRARQLFSIEQTVAQYIQLYREATS